MSRAKQDGPRQLNPAEVRGGEALVLRTRDSWAATRFGLARFNLGQVGHALRAKLRGMDNVYRLDLKPDVLERLFALLDEQGIKFEVWR